VLVVTLVNMVTVTVDVAAPAVAVVNHGLQIVVGMAVTVVNTVAAAVLVETIQALYHLQMAAAVEQCVLSGPAQPVHSHQQIPATFN
jgi:hypothetical protein